MLKENLKIDYNPLVLCYHLFKVVNYQTNVKGYWLDNDGKLFIDNIKIEVFPIIEKCYFNIIKGNMFLQGEKCVFYKNIYNEGVLEYPNGNKTILKNRLEYITPRKPNKKALNKLLKKYRGLTIYNIDNKYIIEIYF